jgi:UDP:flavonoid glycosyltransferase YjiC (YdhE family)
MKITITAVGSRGDIQPYVALAAGFIRAGHEVRLSAPKIFSGLIAGHGIPHLPVSMNPQEIVNHPAVQAASKSGNYILFLRALFREGGALVQTYLNEVFAYCQEGEAVISSMIPYGAYDAAAKRRIPFRRPPSPRPASPFRSIGDGSTDSRLKSSTNPSGSSFARFKTDGAGRNSACRPSRSWDPTGKSGGTPPW